MANNKTVTRLPSAAQLLDSTRPVFVWGDSEFGKLGYGQEAPCKVPEKLKTIRGDKVIYVICGAHNTAFIGESGAIYIAGRGKSMHRQESSVLGLDVLDPFIASPKKLAFNFPNKIKQIQLGNYHAMALTNQGEVFTWGWGEQGQLGHGDDSNQPLPKLVETLREVLYIGAGTQFSMALTYYGELYAWGHNDMGQLGIGNTTMQKSPVRVKKVQNVLHFACGTSHAVAVTWEGAGMQSVVWQWGQQNTHGKVQTLPLEVNELTNKGIHRVACGEWHTIALSLSGEVYTWTLGQTATRVKDLSGVCVKQVACGSHHSLALDDHGVVWSWGSRNHSGQLGRLTAPSSSSAQSTASPGTMRSAPPTGGVDPNAADLIADLLTVPGPNNDTKPALSASSENKPLPLLPISSVSCGAYHSVALSESEPYKLAQYRLLRIERSYALKVQVVVEQYMPALLQLDWASFDALPAHARSRRSVPSPLSPRRELLVEDGASLCRSMFGNIVQVHELNQRVLKDIHSVIEGWDNVGSVGQIFVNHLKGFSIYLSYADNYNTAATNLHVLMNSSDLFAQTLKKKQEEVNGLYQRRDNRMRPRNLTLKNLLIEPIKQIARYVKVLRVLYMSCPSTEADRANLNYALARTYGLLERVCKNFSLVEPIEILKCSLDDYGHPQIGGGTVELLIERLTHHAFIDLEFSNAFLLTYRAFVKPVRFLELLIRRYNAPVPPGVNPQQYTSEVLKPVRQQVIRVLKNWLDSKLSSYDFEDKQSDLVLKVLEFAEQVLARDEEYKRHAEQIKTSLKGGMKVLQLGGGRTSSASISAGSPPTSPSSIKSTDTLKDKSKKSAARLSVGSKGKNDSLRQGLVQPEAAMLEDLTAASAALEIALEDHEIYRKILPRELIQKAWTRENAKDLAPNVTLLSSRFNMLGLWVVYEVTRHENIKDRVTSLAAIIEIGEELLTLKDYSSVLAIASGLNNASLTRLKKTFAKLSEKSLESLERLNHLASGEGNYKLLRNMVTNAEPPVVPCIVFTLKDLTFIEDGNPDQLEGVGINFYKWRLVSDVIQEALQYQNIPYPYPSDSVIRGYLSTHIVKAVQLGEDGLYKQSKKVE